MAAQFNGRIELDSSRRAGLQHLLRRHVAPHLGWGVQPRGASGPLAARPRLRALLRMARWADELLLPRPGPRQPSGRGAVAARGRLPPGRRPGVTTQPGYFCLTGGTIDNVVVECRATGTSTTRRRSVAGSSST